MRQLEKLEDTGFLSYTESPLYRRYITVISGYRKIKSHFFLLYYEAYTKHMNVAFNIFLNLHKTMWKKEVFKKKNFLVVSMLHLVLPITDGEIFQKFLINKVYLMEFFFALSFVLWQETLKNFTKC